MEKTYITSIIKKEAVEYEGPKISALSWQEAEKQAKEQGAVLVGELTQ